MPKTILNFIDYLKDNFFLSDTEKNAYKLAPLNDLSKSHEGSVPISNNFRNARLLELIVAKHLSGLTANIDDQAAIDWQENYQLSKQELITKKMESARKRSLSDFFNLEINPHAHINKLSPVMAKEAARPSREDARHIFPSTPWQAKLATVMAIAFILSVSIVHLNPNLAKKIAGLPDLAITKPLITLIYLYGGESALAGLGIDPIAPEYEAPQINNPIDKNILSSYIVNNQKDFDGKRINVSYEKLDGRVSGAFTFNSTTPSTELLILSQNNEPFRTKIISAINNWINSF